MMLEIVDDLVGVEDGPGKTSESPKAKEARERFYSRIWKKRDGTFISVSDMETSHIQNTIRMLERNGYMSAKDWAAYMIPNRVYDEMPDGAQAAFDLEFAQVCAGFPNSWIDLFREELKNRGVK